MRITVFRYPEQTTVRRLLRHYRIAQRIVYPCGFCAVVMCSSFAQVVLLPPNILTLLTFLVATCVCLLLSVPAILCIPWMRDIECELARRGVKVARGADVESRMDWATMRMIVWMAVAIFGPGLVRLAA